MFISNTGEDPSQLLNGRPVEDGGIGASGPDSLPAPPPRPDRSALKGFGLGISLQLIQVLVLLILPAAIFFIGVTQLVYVVPAIVAARRKGNPRLGLGIAIAAAVVFLLNATCFGVVLFSLRNGIR